ncbi:MAG: MFS transporter [Lachnospiraceae bacterium]
MSRAKQNPEAIEAFREAAKRPFGMRDKIGYAAGDFANDITFVIASLFMMKFYTDVMGVSAALVGVLMMAAKVVDAFTDVAMGQICDHSPVTAKGKFKPWILRFSGPVAVASFLIFANYLADAPMGFKVFWMFFTYLLWGSVCYTGVNIPYGSMASVMTNDPEQRQMLSTWRNIGATLAQIIIAVVLPLVVYTTDQEGHKVLSGNKLMMASLICSILAALVYFVCYSLCTERVLYEQPEGKEKKSTGALFRILFTTRSFIGIIVSALILLVTQLVLTGMASYIYPNYFGNTVMQSLSALLGCGIVLILSTFVTKLADRFGKKELSAAGAVIGAVTLFIVYFIHTHNVVVYVVLYCIAYLGLAFFNLMCWAMIIDVIDDIQVRSGVRSDGTVYSVYSFARKLGQAASSGLTGALLTAVGYTSETAFDTNVVNGIYNTASLIPAIGFVILALSLAFLYPLSKKKVQENNRILAKEQK